MSLIDRVQKDLVVAMKARDGARVSALRLIKSALQNKAIELRKPLTPDEENQVLRTMVKQRSESIENFERAGRSELVKRERDEKALIESYLPEAVSREEIESVVAAVVEELGAKTQKELGAVMKEALLRLRRTGKTVDGKAVNAAVSAKLC